MARRGLQLEVEAILQDLNDEGGYPMSLVCTAEGLPIGACGDQVAGDALAAFTSLFEDVVERARRDLGFSDVDEVSLNEPGTGRTVIRPLRFEGAPRAFLVVRVPRGSSWRRATNRVVVALVDILGDLIRGEAA